VKPGTTFLLGIVVGLSAATLLRRVRIVMEEEEPERVLDRLNESLNELEQRAQNLETRISPN
jgi:hypothetical protein